MSASYFMLKMLKNKRNNRLLPCKREHEHRTKLKKSSTCRTLNNKCRICLNEGFIPIYGSDFLIDLPDAIRTIGGVELNENDEYPKHLCQDCHSLLKGAILFRASARESDQILRQTPTITRSYESPIPSDGEVKNDLEIRQKPIPIKYKCKTCKITFKTLDAHTAHIKSNNHKKVRIQCRICLKLLTPQLYEKHLTRHKSATHLVCDVCGKLYRKDNLLRHLQLHSNELPFQCKACPYRGRFMESLKIHMRTHSGDKPFSCEKCALRFITRSNLNRHLLTHEKEKPFKCIECSRGFYIQRDMDVHLRADHAGIKEFSCRLCGNKYGTRKALMRHELRVHKRDKMAKGRIPLYMQAEFQNSDKLKSAVK